MTHDARPVLLYDGSCGFCRSWVRRLQRVDREERIDFLPSQDRGARPDLPPLEDALVNRAIHFITPDGQVHQGADAAPVILRLLPRWRHAAWLFRIPGVRSIARLTYDWIAVRRHRFGCGPEGCGVGRDGLV